MSDFEETSESDGDQSTWSAGSTQEVLVLQNGQCEKLCWLETTCLLSRYIIYIKLYSNPCATPQSLVLQLHCAFAA